MLAQHRLVKQKQIFGSRKMQLRGVTAGNTNVIVVIPKYSDALTITIKRVADYAHHKGFVTPKKIHWLRPFSNVDIA